MFEATHWTLVYWIDAICLCGRNEARGQKEGEELRATGGGGGLQSWGNRHVHRGITLCLPAAHDSFLGGLVQIYFSSGMLGQTIRSNPILFPHQRFCLTLKPACVTTAQSVSERGADQEWCGGLQESLHSTCPSDQHQWTSWLSLWARASSWLCTSQKRLSWINNTKSLAMKVQ